MVYIFPKYFRTTSPTVIVNIDRTVEIAIISPANFELHFIASAITKEAIAVGVANRTKNIPKSAFGKSINNPTKTAIKGNKTTFKNDDEKANVDALIILFNLKVAPIPINASGRAMIAK